MGIEFIASAEASQDDSTTFTFTTPDVRPGDVLVLACGFISVVTIHLDPVNPNNAGWVEAISHIGVSDGDYIFVASRDVNGSEGSSMSVVVNTPLATSSQQVVCLAYRGAQALRTSQPFAVANVDGSVDFPCPAQLLGNDDLYIGIVHDPDNEQAVVMPGQTRFAGQLDNTTFGVFDLAPPAIGVQTATVTTATLGSAMSFVLQGVSPGRYTRMLTALLPPGRLWRLIPGASVLYALLEGCAIELDRVDRRVGDLLNESIPSTAFELLPEYESELDLAAAPTIEERRANIVARTIQRQRYRPIDFQTTLSSLLALDPEDIVIIERTHAFAVSIGDDREIFRFFVYRDPGLPGTYFVASAQALLDDMKPSHTAGYVIESIDALFDDEFSLYDRDIMGA